MAIYFFSLILTLFTGAKERERERDRAVVEDYERTNDAIQRRRDS